MLKLTVETIITKIRNQETFEAQASDGSFRIKIIDYVPYVCTAIHEGHQLRSELVEKCALSDYERWYEEDPNTVDFIKSFPIVLEAMDSRYEYDLNRKPELAVMKEAWGKNVWEKPLSTEEIEASQEKHKQFYRVIDALAKSLKKQFGTGIFFDIHSYNYIRIDREVPVFNIGSERIDQDRFGKDVAKWRQELAKIEIPNVTTTSEINDIFFGRGYLLEFLLTKHPEILTLATEVKKVYCNEESGETFPQVIEAIQEGFKKAVVKQVSFFLKRHTKATKVTKMDILGGSLQKALVEVDRSLYKMVRSFELLEFVNPINMEQERKTFYASRFNENPIFKYRQVELDVLGQKRALMSIPVESIRDAEIQHMYRDVIQAYMDKVDMLSTLGTPKFLYNSMRYFGEPSLKDVDNARFMLYCPPFEPVDEERSLTVEDASELFYELGKEYGFNFKIKVSERVVSPATVLNAKKTVVLKKGAKFGKRNLASLGHHEIGVHMVTTMNSNLQPLKLVNIGLPKNTMTQEGLAILSELLSDTFRYTRLHELAYRVFAVRSVVRGDSFVETFDLLHVRLGLARDAAFNLSTRVHRGGGFTKEHLYLEGFKRILTMYNAGESLDNLLIGKTSLEYKSTLDEMIDRGLLLKPKYITSAFLKPEKINPNLEYILSGLK